MNITPFLKHLPTITFLLGIALLPAAVAVRALGLEVNAAGVIGYLTVALLLAFAWWDSRRGTGSRPLARG